MPTMPKPISVQKQQISKIEDDLGKLKPREEVSIREAIRMLNPQIEQAVKMGYLRTEVNEMIAKRLNCTPDLVARYHSENRRKRKRS